MIAGLYSTVAVLVAIGYLPQALRLLLVDGPCDDISIPAWSIWAYTAIVSLLYSIFEIGDVKLSIVNGINAFFIILIIGITLYKRRRFSGQITVHFPEEDALDLENVPEVKDMDTALEEKRL